ncbi:class 1 fructose-bisphosphatase [Candidatus Kapaibacterium sp.]
MPTLLTSRLTTISHHIDEEQNLHPEATGEFTSILNDLTLALRIISRDVRRAGLNDVLGLTKDTNVHGEQVRKLDTYSNDVIKRAMLRSGHICIMASEEDDDIILTPSNSKAKYVLVFDPLDGSSNIDVNVTIGTIFGLYKRIDPYSDETATIDDVIQPGYKLQAAGYALYGSSTLLVYTTGHGVHAFTYDPTLGEFLLTKENIRLPHRGKSYSVNEGYYYKWSENMRQYVDFIKTPSSDKSRPYSLRYIGTAVADIHRTLLNGGIFLYPADNSHPNGKLRIVYEANALAMIIEQAGGRASDGEKRILDIKPDNIHQRIPLIAGSKEDVIECESFLKGEHPMQKII